MFVTSCSRDESAPDVSPSNIAEFTTSGLWKVEYFEKYGINETTYFLGFNFKFNTDKTVVATDGNTTINGIWNSFNDSGKTIFDLIFAVLDGPLEEISEDWIVVSNSASRLELTYINEVTGKNDHLIFIRK